MVNFNYSAIIRNLILSDPVLKSFLDENVFPIVAEAGTIFPFIVYRRSAYYKGNPNKDDYDNKFSVELAILESAYKRSIQILTNVIRVLDGYDDGNISIEVTNTYEDFQDDTYIQKVNLDIKYNN